MTSKITTFYKDTEFGSAFVVSISSPGFALSALVPVTGSFVILSTNGERTMTSKAKVIQDAYTKFKASTLVATERLSFLLALDDSLEMVSANAEGTADLNPAVI